MHSFVGIHFIGQMENVHLDSEIFMYLPLYISMEGAGFHLHIMHISCSLKETGK